MYYCCHCKRRCKCNANIITNNNVYCCVEVVKFNVNIVIFDCLLIFIYFAMVGICLLVFSNKNLVY